MNGEVTKILRLVEKGLLSKEQGYILVKAHYENVKNDIEYENLDNSLLGLAEEEAIENSAELIDELVEASKSSSEEWEQAEAYLRALDNFVKNIIGQAASGDENEEQLDSDDFVKKDFYLAGEKVYVQRNVSLKGVRRGKKYKANFLVGEIKDSEGGCIEDKRLRAATLELINEGFCGRYRKIKDGNVIKIFIE